MDLTILFHLRNTLQVTNADSNAAPLQLIKKAMEFRCARGWQLPISKKFHRKSVPWSLSFMETVQLHSHYKLLDPGKRKAHRLDSRPAVTAQRLPRKLMIWVHSNSPYTFKLQSFGARYNMIQYGFVMVCDGLWVLSSSPTALPMSVIFFCASGMCLITASEDATQAARLLGDSETPRLGSEKLTLWMGSSSDAWHTSCNHSTRTCRNQGFAVSPQFQHVPSLAVLSGTHQPIACTKMCLA